MKAIGHKQSIVAAGALLGIGMGGLLDGSLSSLAGRGGLSSDGAVRVVLCVLTALGVASLWMSAKRPHAVLSTRSFVASLGIGWGVFNVVAEVFNRLLGMHQVRPGSNDVAWELGFVVVGVVVLAACAMVVKNDHAGDPPRATSTPSERPAAPPQSRPLVTPAPPV